MIQHRDTLLSENILEKQFVCDLNACKGACCIEGDRGAPLEQEDIEQIQQNLPTILKELPADHAKDIRNRGFHEVDVDGEPVTLCRENGECVFVNKDPSGMLQCAIEQSHRKGLIDYIKPISCHLYPVRLIKAGEFTGLNYHEWHICKAACALGKKLKVAVYEFAKGPLVRKFGNEWYGELEEIATEYQKEKDNLGRTK